MSFEQSPEYFERSFMSTEARLHGLINNMSEIACKQDTSLRVEGALYDSVLDAYGSHPVFKDLIDDFVTVRTDMTETHLRYMIRSAVQKQAIRRYGIRYPRDFEKKSQWDTILSGIISSDESLVELQHDLHERHLQTNIPDRYKSVVLAANWARENGRMGEDLTIIDFGCSRNLGLKTITAIEMNREMEGKIFHNFGETEVVDPTDHPDITRATELKVDERLSRAATLAHATPTGLRIGIGYDIEDMNEPGNKEWAFANLTPNEHETGLAATLDFFENSFNQSASQFRSSIKFRQEDILLGDHLDYLDKTENDESGFADITLLFTVLNQMSERQRGKALMRAIRYTKPTGIVLIQDFARVMVDVPVELEFMDRNWNTNFSYRTIMLDMQNRRRFNEIMCWNGGRANQLYIPQESNNQPLLVPGEGFAPVDLRTYIGKFALQG